MILNRQREVRVARRKLELFLRRLKRELGLAKSDVTVCLVSDAEMARMNRHFRKKKGPTDVLSFAMGPGRKPGRGPRGTRMRQSRKYLGDIAIAPATARRYAQNQARTLESELRVLTLHGVLHLLGYDHETDRGEMDRLEHKLRNRLGIR